MVGNLLALVVLAALVILFAWLTRRALASQHRILKWFAVVLAGLLTLILALVFIVSALGVYKIYWPHDNPVSNVKVAGTPEEIARGQKFALFCAGCHSSAGLPPLDGGTNNFLGPAGQLYPPNLTPAGELRNWSDGQIIRAIREGVHGDGRALLVMPSETFHNLSDADVQAIVAYLRSQPAVKHDAQTDTPSNSTGFLGTLLIGAGLFPTSAQAPITQPITAPAPGTAAYGEYLVNVIGCRVCHGSNLAGGTTSQFGGPPAGPNLTVLVPKWAEGEFLKTIRTGVDPSGHRLSDEMPWKQISAFASDEDLHAIYLYMHGLSPIIKGPQ